MGDLILPLAHHIVIVIIMIFIFVNIIIIIVMILIFIIIIRRIIQGETETWQEKAKMTPSFSWKPSETPFLTLFAVDANDANEDFDDKKPF